MNNKQGSFFENRIIGGCIGYDLFNRAFIEKTPEPFKISKPIGQGKFQGSFTKKAQPDFKGTLKFGKAIVFEAKYTSQDKMNASVLSDEQIKCLKKHYDLGAITGVVIGIKERAFFVPWRLWSVMKEEYNLDFKNFKRDYRQFYEDGTIQEEGHIKGGEVVFAKEYYKNRQLKCVKKIQNVYGYKILTVTELYDESGKPLPIPSGTF